MPGFSPVGSTPVDAIGGNTGQYFPAPGGIVFHGSNVVSNQLQVLAGVLAFHGSSPVTILAAPRVTWMGLEALHVGAAARRVSWLGIEVLRSTASIPTEWVVSWMGLEVAHVGNAQRRLTWMGLEVAHVGQAAQRVTWMGLEVLRSVADFHAGNGWVCLITG